MFVALYAEIEKLGKDPQHMLYTRHNNVAYLPIKSTFAMSKAEIDDLLDDGGSAPTPIYYATSRVLDEGGQPASIYRI